MSYAPTSYCTVALEKKKKKKKNPVTIFSEISCHTCVHVNRYNCESLVGLSVDILRVCSLYNQHIDTKLGYCSSLHQETKKFKFPDEG